MRPLATDDRAMRNVVGYVLTVSVILASVGVVSTTGVQQLETVRDTEQVGNAERSLELIAANFDELEQGDAVAQTSELDPSGGRLAVTNGTTVRVGVEGTGFNETFAVGALRYRFRDTTFAYESGGLFRTDEGQYTSLQSRPSLVCTPDRAVVSVVALAAADSQQVSGGVASVTARVSTRRVPFPVNRTGPDSAADAEAVNVTVTSPRAAGWEQYFSAAGNWSAVPASPDTYRCGGVEHVYVRYTAVTVSFSS